MTRYTEVAAWFDALCEASADDQRRALDTRVPDALRSQVEALLVADRIAGDVLATRTGAGAELLAADLARHGHERMGVDGGDPEHIGPYTVRQRLGAGAMGVVFDAEQAHPRRDVALKVLHPWLHSDLALELFRFEAQALGQVQHPAIPVVYEAGEHDGLAYLSMEKVDGVTLDTWVRRRRPDIDTRLALLAAIAEAVEAAHQADLLHRDLKPSNILVDADDRPHLLDFGVAAPLLSRSPGAQPGTPLYMSPEQARGEALDPRSDVHALGTVGYELVTGRPPVTEGTLDEIRRAKERLPPPAHELVDGLDPDVSRVLARALAPAIDARTATAAAFARDLEDVRQQVPLAFGGRPMGYRIDRWRRRHRNGLGLALLAVGVTLLGGLGTVGWQLRRAQQAEEQAVARLRLVREAASDARRRGAVADGTARLEAFARAPENRGRHAVSMGWLWWAEQIRDEDPQEALSALAEAYVAADGASQARAARRALGRELAAGARWPAVWRLRDLLDEADQDALREELRLAATALRDLDGLTDLGHDAPLLRRLLGHARPVGTSQRSTWLDVDGDGVVEWLAFESDTRVHDAWGQPRWSMGHEDVTGWITHHRMTPHDGWLYTALEGDGHATLVRAKEGHPAEVLAELPDGRVLDVELARGPDGPMLLVGLGFPERGLRWVSLDGREQGWLSPDAVGSDVMSIVTHDVDGDGIDEVYVAAAAWEAYAVRALAHGSDGYRMVAEAPLGVVTDLLWLDPDEGPPRLAATKVDIEADRRAFGDEQPFGPEPGVYLLDPTELSVVGHRPLPVPDGPHSNSERAGQAPYVGDFDGDGTLDMALSLWFFDLNGADSLTWLITDVLGGGAEVVLAGMEPRGAADLDGDGVTELLVRDDLFDLWALGGDGTPLAPWEPPGHTVAQVPPAPATDSVVERGWERARELARLGLDELAADSFAELGDLATTDPVRAEAWRWAGRLYARAQRPAAAAAAFSSAGAGGAREVSPDLVPVLVSTLQLDEARQQQVAEPLVGFGWLDELEPRRSLLPGETLGSWSLRIPGALERRPDGVWVEAFNDAGTVAVMDVEVVSEVVELELAVTLEHLELGAGLAFELVDPDGASPREALVALWGQGGGGFVKLRQHCGGQSFEELGHVPYTPGMRAPLRVARVGAERRVRCGWLGAGGATTWRFVPDDPVAPGRYQLRLRVHGVPDYEPPTRISARIDALEARGLRPLAPVAPDPAVAARAALFEGRRPTAWAPEDAVWVAVATGDPQALAAALAERVAAGDDRRLRWFLRRYPGDITPPLTQLAGDDFARLFYEAWRYEGRGPGLTDEVMDAVLRPPLEVLPATTSEGRAVRLWRAEVRRQRGELGRARMLARSVIEAEGASDRQRADGWLLWAQLETGAARDAAVAKVLALDGRPSRRRALVHAGLDLPRSD